MQSVNKMTVKAVIFDLDGTIASFNIDYMVVRAEARGFLINTGLPASILSTNESIFEMLKKTEIFMRNNGLPEKTFDETRRKVLAIAEKHELEAAKTTSLLPGVPETLEVLKKANMKIGLCTVNSEKSVNYILKKFRIAKFFDAVTSRDDVKYVKPNTEQLEKTLNTLGVNPREVMVVGDGAVDMKCSNELKAIAVGLPTGVSSPRDLISSGANYIITSLTDIPALTEYVNKSMKE